MVGYCRPGLSGQIIRKMGLLAGWLVGRLAAFVASLISARLGTPLPGMFSDRDDIQVVGTPIQWFFACVAAALLGRVLVLVPVRLGTGRPWH
ncbi:hypothetical protein AK812_SmicGene41461 [Symbiodinium microadriaticum]|uniref:Uncharacterized protein n=1 Tax=Symbiodinium microadriaticum TaxID=2951 RepID=A0A1Q9C618_SYMMI|nr:hypothetical protein AK812_SmicGene41461 [Symbiodinium microadriaticum]